MSGQAVSTVLLGRGDVFLHDGDRLTVHQVLLGGKPGVVQVLAFKGATRRLLDLDPTADVAVIGGAR